MAMHFPILPKNTDNFNMITIQVSLKKCDPVIEIVCFSKRWLFLIAETGSDIKQHAYQSWGLRWISILNKMYSIRKSFYWCYQNEIQIIPSSQFKDGLTKGEGNGDMLFRDMRNPWIGLTYTTYILRQDCFRNFSNINRF